MNLPAFFEEDRAAVDAALDRLMPSETAQPPSIHRAMRYSVQAGGKRVRPILCLESARIFASDMTPVLPVACALEFIHTYSLIHDDLPALDNDDLRRGVLPQEIWRGDRHPRGRCVTDAGVRTLCQRCYRSARRVAILSLKAPLRGSGWHGPGAKWRTWKLRPGFRLRTSNIHRSKTAALIRASVVSGAIGGGADDENVARLKRFGETIGWAFQVIDDILDVEESSAALGKTAGKDAAQQKATYPSLFGLEKSSQFAKELETRAMAESSLMACAPRGCESLPNDRPPARSVGQAL
jgi:geranylgeranyl diphosphate synthase type II